MTMSDRTDIADRVISNDRLIHLMLEKDRQIYRLEADLHDVRQSLQRIARAHKEIDEIEIS